MPPDMLANLKVCLFYSIWRNREKSKLRASPNLSHRLWLQFVTLMALTHQDACLRLGQASSQKSGGNEVKELYGRLTRHLHRLLCVVSVYLGRLVVLT